MRADRDIDPREAGKIAHAVSALEARRAAHSPEALTDAAQNLQAQLQAMLATAENGRVEARRQKKLAIESYNARAEAEIRQRQRFDLGIYDEASVLAEIASIGAGLALHPTTGDLLWTGNVNAASPLLRDRVRQIKQALVRAIEPLRV